MSMSKFQPARNNHNGFTLIEVLIIFAAIGLLIVLATPAYQQHQEQEHIEQATKDISAINITVTKYLLANNKLPKDLSVIGLGDMRDPWGNRYRYISHSATQSKQYRKDNNLLPINNDYDIYSVGKDGSSEPALTAKLAHDDIVLANNGKWIGIVEHY